jgi:hypothetical protein
LPPVDYKVPAGYLGAIFLEFDPSLTLETTGEADVETSVTLHCYAGYEWNEGTQTRTDYCTASHKPLALTSASGLDATVTGRIGASASLDDLPGIKGSIDASLHAGYHPAQTPVAEIDASSDYELQATLANIWKGAPTVKIAHGTIFSKVLATWGQPPPSATGTPAITVSPSVAWPWSDTVCGGGDPFAGDQSDYFTMQGTGFQPGESVTVWVSWLGGVSYNVTADLSGAFTVSDYVGEVPSVFYTDFDVSATGSDGSAAYGSIELESNGCIYQTDTDGTVNLQWGENGVDPGSEVDLYIDGNFTDSATADSLGSGGSQDAFACPDAGSYTWQTTGYVNGSPVQASSTEYCTPAASAASKGHGHATRAASGSAAAAIAG